MNIYLRISSLGVVPLFFLAWMDWRIALCVWAMMWFNNLMLKGLES